MATIKPFSAILPASDKAHLVASRSYINYTEEQLKEKLKSNPYTFLHIVNPDISSEIQLNDSISEKFKRVRLKFKHFVKEKIFHKPYDKCLYIYQQKNSSHSYTGLIGGACINEYFSGDIKVHEQTLTKRENLFKDYLHTTKINAEPVLLSYPDDTDINNLIEKYTQSTAEFEFQSTDGVNHSLWIIDDLKHVNLIQDYFTKIPSLYIADGHHRSASSSILGKQLRENNPEHTGEESYNFFMSYFLPESQLNILDFNRVVKDLNGHKKEDILSMLEQNFDIDCKGKNPYKPSMVHNFSMYIDEEWYSMFPKEGTFNSNHPVKSLDSQILSDLILSSIFGISDLKTDKRIGFVGGNKGIEGLQEKVDNGEYKIAFGLFPVTIEQLKLVADTKNIMPPKSTYIEPKLRSGLTIYPIID